MENVICIYHDGQGDQDMIVDPNLDEALSNFNTFDWGDVMAGSDGMKVLYFCVDIDSSPSLMITNNLFEEAWCVAASMQIRRRFCGPFFKKSVTKMCMDIDRLAVDEIIRTYYASSPEAFLEWLNQGDEFEFGAETTST